jgi:biopolymer transport protein ExbD
MPIVANLLSAKKDSAVDLNRVMTPMLDMTFQILFFLIMSFRMPSPEGQINVVLPSDDPGPAPVALAAGLEEAEEYVLRLYIADRDGGGAITDLNWREKGQRIDDAAAEFIPRIDPGDRNEKDDYFRSLNTLMYGLVVKLKQYQPKEGGKQPSIKIECPSKLRYSEMLKAMDVMRKLKFQNVGVVPIPKG